MKLPDQINRFLVTGSVNTAFGYFVYAVGILTFDLPHLLAVVLSYAAGVVFGYLTFQAFVFKGSTRDGRSFARFARTYFFLLIANLVALYALVDLGDWNKLLAQAILVPPFAAISFVVNRSFVFKN